MPSSLPHSNLDIDKLSGNYLSFFFLLLSCGRFIFMVLSADVGLMVTVTLTHVCIRLADWVLKNAASTDLSSSCDKRYWWACWPNTKHTAVSNKSSPLSEYFSPHLGEYVSVLSALEKLNVAILKAMDKTKEVGYGGFHLCPVLIFAWHININTGCLYSSRISILDPLKCWNFSVSASAVSLNARQWSLRSVCCCAVTQEENTSQHEWLCLLFLTVHFQTRAQRPQSDDFSNKTFAVRNMAAVGVINQLGDQEGGSKAIHATSTFWTHLQMVESV